jgi:PHD/YefM family antitoxin component YafN of YafNO toxin-antitoxin module
VVVLVLLFTVGVFHAQTPSEDLRSTVKGTVEIDKKTQEQREAWAAEKASLEARYRTSKANVKYLTERIAVERERETAVLASASELERRMREAKVLEVSLTDTLNVVMRRLEAFVAGDLPFLVEERQQRLAALRVELARPDVAGAEKLRRLLEALQVETEYGKAVEVGQERVALEGDSVYVDVLRVGRVSLLFRTTDGKAVGAFDPATRQWTRLPGQYESNIARAIEMATRLRPVQLIALPLGRINS